MHQPGQDFHPRPNAVPTGSSASINGAVLRAGSPIPRLGKVREVESNVFFCLFVCVFEKNKHQRVVLRVFLVIGLWVA